MATPLYCPFCSDPVEGALACPTCGLDLVTLGELRAQERNRQRRRDPLDRFFTLRRGKGLVLAGVAVFAIGFFLPWIGVAGHSLSGYALARAARLLWAIPAAALTLAGVVVSRRTVEELLGARAVAVFLAVVPLAVTLMALGSGLGELSSGERSRVSCGFGLVFVIGGSVIATLGAPRLGKDDRRDAR